MTDMTLFKGNALVNSDLFKSLQDMNKTLAGGASGSSKRISIRGMRFREYNGGEQVNVSKEDWMNLVIVNAAPISRTYYEGTYDAENPTPPKCWSTDTQAPSQDVPVEHRMASKCADCKMNIKGSGQGESRACRFAQRLAVTLEGKPEDVYQLQLPATSVFGEQKDGKMPMQAYAKFLNSHNTPIIAVVTQAYFDVNAETPKLFFKPVRPLNEEELNAAVAAKDSPEAIKAITLTVSQTDGVKAKDKPKAAAPTASAKKVVPVEDDEEVIDEPKKTTTKKATVEVADNDLASIVTDWDDE
jgi:hypothetical protein